MPRKNISSGGPFEAKVGYSRAVRVGPHIWVAGCTSMTADGLVGRGDLYTQARQAFVTAARALEHAGAGLEHVVRTRMFLTDISRWQEAARAHGELFAAIRPAATMVEVRALIDPDMLIEIEVDAYVE